MFPPETFQPLLVDLARSLESRGIRFALTGGLVSAFYGEPRYTQDVDIVVDRDTLQSHQDMVLAEFQAAGYLLDAQGVKQAIQRGRHFQLLHQAELLKFDFYPRELVPGELSRSIRAEIFSGVLLPIASRPDLIVSKLIWISKGSHKSRRDLRQLMRRATPEADARVRDLADGLSLLPLFEEVLAESDEIVE